VGAADGGSGAGAGRGAGGGGGVQINFTGFPRVPLGRGATVGKGGSWAGGDDPSTPVTRLARAGLSAGTGVGGAEESSWAGFVLVSMMSGIAENAPSVFVVHMVKSVTHSAYCLCRFSSLVVFSQSACVTFCGLLWCP